MSDRFVAQTATYTTHNTHKRQISEPPGPDSNPQSHQERDGRPTPWTTRTLGTV